MRPIFRNKTMVKTDPLSGLRFFGAFFVISGLVASVWTAFRWSDMTRSIPLLVIALFGASLFWYAAPWAQVDKRRQSAVRQENALVPLAREQPVPDETALSLPCKIKLRPRWTIPPICFCVLTPLSCSTLLLLVYTTHPVPVDPGWIPFSIVSSIVWSALAALIPFFYGWHTIKVTEDGLKVQECGIHSLGCNMSIQWDEIRLFAIYPTRKHMDFPMYYELASQTAIVRWKRMRPGMRSRLTKMPVHFDDYNRQMDALLSVIAAKTGLPLYDLR